MDGDGNKNKRSTPSFLKTALIPCLLYYIILFSIAYGFGCSFNYRINDIYTHNTKKEKTYLDSVQKNLDMYKLAFGNCKNFDNNLNSLISINLNSCKATFAEREYDNIIPFLLHPESIYKYPIKNGEINISYLDDVIPTGGYLNNIEDRGGNGWDYLLIIFSKDKVYYQSCFPRFQALYKEDSKFMIKSRNDVRILKNSLVFSNGDILNNVIKLDKIPNCYVPISAGY